MSDTIHKSELKGKYVEYLDDNGAYRISEVKKIIGNKLKVKIPGRRRLKTVEMKFVICNIHHGHCRRDIDWSIRGKKQ